MINNCILYPILLIFLCFRATGIINKDVDIANKIKGHKLKF